MCVGGGLREEEKVKTMEESGCMEVWGEYKRCNREESLPEHAGSASVQCAAEQLSPQVCTFILSVKTNRYSPSAANVRFSTQQDRRVEKLSVLVTSNSSS